MRFTKMEALGNDFVVLDGIRQRLHLTPETIRTLADRRRGVGCDQLLIAEPPAHIAADVRYRIFNADGTEVEHCGNGVRCLARFLVDEGLAAPGVLRIETDGRITEAEPRDDGQVSVDMGPPELEPARIPFQAPVRQEAYRLATSRGEQTIGAVSMGNPHAVLRVDDMTGAPVAELGPEIERHPRFPRRVNVGFMEVCTRDRIRLRVFERGVGETPACGTGACAAVVAGRLRDWLDAPVTVELTGGVLVIHWLGPGRSVWMTGPARTVFRGEIELPASAAATPRGPTR
ncbi:diaminopimelate epimerase [Halorhodospira halophila SL1]|uniref:Diaminopimelate epimerase n=2 Tax=Halorhodospira halophila TaxID=1053 RepID=DAPF_HALHL|nr:RecName: Full=Diaminopimelate epimerase; Short=DAP epimerase; AltName: Full=PLP-independent amino acid racemase [Halorhodospira halophila SL1]ABM61975.1 diaminopimelate epimerase [Halorhodospira halophila SL1]MBK1729697.1 diaminopimelate epimerase [Halorhodospira halophila]